MSFLYPSFLWALSLLIIPIIIHLFNFRRVKKVQFSNVQFLEAVKQKSSNKLKLKHYLALLARLLMITFLVLAFAQPYLPGSKSAVKTNQVYLYLDNSNSMSIPIVGNLSAFDEAYTLVNGIVDLFPRETRYKILTNDFAPFSNSFKTGDEIVELTTELKLSDNTRSLESVLSRLAVEGNEENPSEVFIISDFQKSTIGLNNVYSIDDQINQYNLLPLATEEASNVFVDTLFLEKPFLFNEESNKLLIRLRNGGTREALDVLVKFFIEENQVASTSVDLAAGATQTLEFDLNYNLQKINRCRIELDDYPVVYDNEHYFVLKLANRVKVLEIRDEQASDAFAAVYGNNQLFDFTQFDERNIDYSQLENADLIVLNELGSINKTLMPVFQSFLNEGGDLLVIPAVSTDSISYTSLLAAAIVTNPARPAKSALAQLDADNPFYQDVFEEATDRYEMPQATKLKIWTNRGLDLIQFSDGQPFMTQIPRGKGQIYVTASPMKDDFTNFHRHALFVPVAYKMALTAARSSNQLSHTLDRGVISVNMDSLSYNDIYYLEGNGQSLVPDQRISNNALVLQIPQDEINAGYYDITLNGTPLNTIALNTSKKESFTDQLSRAEIAQLVFDAGNVNVSSIESSENYLSDMKGQYQGKDLWKYALILALVFLLAEVLILRFL